MMSPYVRVVVSGLLPLLVSAAALAQSTDETTPNDIYNLSLAELGQVEISIATGNSTPLDKAPATASVIYAAEIEAMGARSLNEVLETVPGLHVSLSTLSRLDSVYSIRGIHTGFNPQVLLLMNGIPVQSSLQGGRPSLFRLPVASIARVEVIRGPGSAIYGADAYSGVINVITKDAAAINGIEIGARRGSFNSNDFWLQSATAGNQWGVAFNMAYQESDGDKDRRINSDLQSTLDETFGTDASLAPGHLSTRYKVLDTHLAISSEKLQLNLWSWISKDAGIGAGAAQALDYEGEDDSKLWMADVTYRLNDDSDIWDHRLRMSYSYYDLQARFNLMPRDSILPIGSDGNLNFNEPAGAVYFPDGLRGNPGQRSEDTQFDLISIYNGWDTHRLRLAVGSRRQTLESRESKNYGPGIIDGSSAVVDGTLTDVSDTPFVFLPDSARTVHYFSIQDEWQLIPDLTLTAGLRYDNYSDFGGTTNPRVAIVWAANELLTTKLMYGSAFRAPSFSEQRYKNNPVSLGNQDLDPEKIDTVELSFNYRVRPTVQTTLTLFTYQATDMIEFMPDARATTRTAQNTRDQDGQGFEWEVGWQPTPNLRLNGNYSWQETEDKQTGLAVPDAPGRQFKLGAYWEFKPSWSLSSQVYWVGDRHRAADDNRAAIDDYALVNLTLRRKNLLPNLDLSLALRNLTNEDAREPSNGTIAEDYPLESRNIWLELKYLFR